MRALFAFFAIAAFAGCETTAPKRDYTPAVVDFFLESTDARAVSVTLPNSGTKISIAPAPALMAGDIANVELMQVDLGRCLMFQLTPTAARDFYKVSVTNQGRRLVMLLNGAAFGARRLEGAISDGALLMFVEVPDDSLPTLVANLKRTTADLQRAIAKKK